HSTTRTFPNPASPDYQRIEPALSRPAWDATKGWADLILYGSFATVIEKENPKSKLSKAKARGGQTRIIHTAPHAVFDAKHRHGLPPEIPLGDTPKQAWRDFVNAFPKNS